LQRCGPADVVQGYSVVHGTHSFLDIEYQKAQHFAIRRTDEIRYLFLGIRQKKACDLDNFVPFCYSGSVGKSAGPLCPVFLSFFGEMQGSDDEIEVHRLASRFFV